MPYKKIIQYALSAGLLIFLLMQMDLSLLLSNVQFSNLWLLTLAVFFVLGQILFLNLRWHDYLNVGRVVVPFKTSVLINLAGYFANTLFVASIGGVIAKSGLSIKYGVPVFQALFATFLDRFMTLLALIILSAVGIVFLQHVIDTTLLIMLSLSIVFMILSIVLVIGFLRLGTFKDFILAHRKISKSVAVLRLYMENYPLMVRTFIYSLFAQISFILGVYALSFGLHDVSGLTLEFLAIIPLVALVSALPISYGGWGVREGAFVYSLGLLGFPMEEAFLLSIQVGVVTLIAPLLVGVPYLFKRESWNKMKANFKTV